VAAVSSVTRCEPLRLATMDPILVGDGLDYVEIDVEGYGWRCDGCGLVWTRKWHAETCESRSHASSFEQGPYGVTHTLNGVPQGPNIRYYTRRAYRRDGRADAAS